jgi:hypothetical protein
MKATSRPSSQPASANITKRIAELGDWRGETLVKLTFARGAALKDPKKLFNSSLDGNVRRAIDLHEGEKINATAFKQLIRATLEANSAALAQRAAKKK